MMYKEKIKTIFEIFTYYIFSFCLLQDEDMRFFFKGNQTESFSNTTINETDISEDTLNKVFFILNQILFFFGNFCNEKIRLLNIYRNSKRI
jgi:hypothetical protein